jgi:hypothetical protein
MPKILYVGVGKEFMNRIFFPKNILLFAEKD